MSASSSGYPWVICCKQPHNLLRCPHCGHKNEDVLAVLNALIAEPDLSGPSKSSQHMKALGKSEGRDASSTSSNAPTHGLDEIDNALDLLKARLNRQSAAAAAPPSETIDVDVKGSGIKPTPSVPHIVPESASPQAGKLWAKSDPLSIFESEDEELPTTIFPRYFLGSKTDAQPSQAAPSSETIDVDVKGSGIKPTPSVPHIVPESASPQAGKLWAKSDPLSIFESEDSEMPATMYPHYLLGSKTGAQLSQAEPATSSVLPTAPASKLSSRVKGNSGGNSSPATTVGLLAKRKPGIRQASSAAPLSSAQALSRRQEPNANDRIKLNNGNRFHLRVKQFAGLTCTVCDLGRHPTGHCQKNDEEKWYEVLIHVQSNPPLAKQCTVCKDPRIAVKHTTEEHGYGAYYDHPDNKSLDRFIAHYNPLPDLDRGLDRYDVPPLDILLLRWNERKPDIVNEWKDQFRAQTTGNWHGKLPVTYFTVTSRSTRYREYMALKRGEPVSALHDAGGSNIGPTASGRAPAWQRPRIRVTGLRRCPNPCITPADDLLPAQAYVNWLWEFLEPNEQEEVQRLYKQWKSQRAEDEDLIWEHDDKVVARRRARDEIMVILTPKEVDAAHILKSREESLPGGGPFTSRKGLVRQRFSLGTPFRPKATWAYPEKFASANRKSIPKLASLNTVVPRQEGDVAGGDIDPETPAYRSLAYHIQDYPLLKEQFDKHLSDWRNSIQADRGSLGDWFGKETLVHGVLNKSAESILSQLKPGMDGFDQAQSALKSYVEAVMTAISKLLDSLKEESQAAERNFQNRNGNPITQAEFDGVIEDVTRCFDDYNKSIDSAMSGMLGDQHASDILEKARKSGGGALYQEYMYVMGDMLPAETKVKAVIPRLAWPLEIVLDVRDRKLGTLEQWANETEEEDLVDVPVPDTSSGMPQSTS